MLFTGMTDADGIRAVVESGPAPNIVSGFFPAPQRGRIKSATVESRGAAGATFRRIGYEMQSILQTHIFRKKGWASSPYASRFAVRTKQRESKLLAEVITTKPVVIKRIVR
jgi:hypothetical protein